MNEGPSKIQREGAKVFVDLAVTSLLVTELKKEDINSKADELKETLADGFYRTWRDGHTAGMRARQEALSESIAEVKDESERLKKLLSNIRDMVAINPLDEQKLPPWAASTYGEIGQMIQQELG